MTIRSFTGFLNLDLFGSGNASNGQTFTLSPSVYLEILMSDGATDSVVEGDSSGGSTSTENSEDPENDQYVFIRNSSGTVLVDGVEFYLESEIQFSIGGQTYTAYHFEDENGLDFTILPPDVPSGTAIVTSIDYSPNPDEVDYALLTSDDETIEDGVFTQLDLSGDDEIHGGVGNDTLSGAGGDDTIFGDKSFVVNGSFMSDQADNSWSAGVVEGWYNDGSGGLIERWGQGFQGLFTDDGTTFIELDANTVGPLDHVQTDLDLEEGVFYVITIDHAARASGGTTDDFFITHNGVSLLEVSPATTG